MDEGYATERWLPVVGYEGVYEVSDFGRVRSLPRMIPTKWETPRFHPGGILKISVSSTTGYRRVTLVDAARGAKRYASVHSLVLEAFVGPRPDGMECCHGDGDRGNAALWNLRWDTRSENANDAVRHGTNAHARRLTCQFGHPYTKVRHNNAKGWRRECRQCAADRRAVRRALAQRAK